MKMFGQLLHLHWKTARWPLAAMVLLAFGLPMLVTRMIQVSPTYTPERIITAAEMVQREYTWVTLFPILALAVGITLALTAWSWDHYGRHIYALSLPVSRGEYGLLKLGAGLVLLAVPVLALFVGSALGLFLTQLPPELHGYLFSFTTRFALAALVIYTATFALAASTVRTTVIILIGLIVVFVFGSIVVLFIGETMHVSLRTPAGFMYDALLNWPGPFSIFGGSWLLIDA